MGTQYMDTMNEVNLLINITVVLVDDKAIYDLLLYSIQCTQLYFTIIMTAQYAMKLQQGQMSECGVGMGLGTMTAGMGGVEENF